jgi:hypothetical protein
VKTSSPAIRTQRLFVVWTMPFSLVARET